jgi:hypothetical protein
MKTIEVNGRPIGNGQTVVVDHSVQSFLVVVRSMGGVSPDTIKNLIERRHEVVRIEPVDAQLYVRAGVPLVSLYKDKCPATTTKTKDTMMNDLRIFAIGGPQNDKLVQVAQEPMQIAAAVEYLQDIAKAIGCSVHGKWQGQIYSGEMSLKDLGMLCFA